VVHKRQNCRPHSLSTCQSTLALKPWAPRLLCDEKHIVRHCVSGGSVCHCGGTYWSRLCRLSGITRVPMPLYSTGQPNLVGVVFVFRLAAALSRGKRPRHCGRRLCRSYHRPNSACTAAQLQLLLHLRRRWVVRCFLAAVVHVPRSLRQQCSARQPIRLGRSAAVNSFCCAKRCSRLWAVPFSEGQI
jgi:hypothetical protein